MSAKITYNQALASGRMDVNPGRFKGRDVTQTGEPLGDPPNWLTLSQMVQWANLVREFPGIGAAMAGKMEIAAVLRAKLSAEEIKPGEMNTLSRTLTELYDAAGRVDAGDDGDDL